MHVIIAAITALAGLVWALHSLQNSGVDLNAFNPFTWARRRKWQKLYGAKPIYCLKKPMEAAAVLMLGIVKQEGEISREQKLSIIELFQSNFSLSHQQAQDVFVASAYLVKDEAFFEKSVKNILQPSVDQFEPDMRMSLLNLLNEVAHLEGAPSAAQTAIIEAVKIEFNRQPKTDSKWG